MRERLEVYNSVQNRRWVQAFLSPCLCFATRKVQSIGLRWYEKYSLLFRRISVVKEKIWKELFYPFYCETPLRSNPLCVCIRYVRDSIHRNKDMRIKSVAFASCFVGILLQSALQLLWILACSTIVEYSQQEGFYRITLPATHQTPNLEDQWLERSNSRHQASPTSNPTRANPSNGRWKHGREISENFAENSDFHFTFGFLYMP